MHHFDFSGFAIGGLLVIAASAFIGLKNEEVGTFGYRFGMLAVLSAICAKIFLG